jgi:hypothetical protein
LIRFPAWSHRAVDSPWEKSRCTARTEAYRAATRDRAGRIQIEPLSGITEPIAPEPEPRPTAEDLDQLRQAVRRLRGRDKTVVRQVLAGRTLREIGQDHGVTGTA